MKNIKWNRLNLFKSNNNCNKKDKTTIGGTFYENFEQLITNQNISIKTATKFKFTFKYNRKCGC